MSHWWVAASSGALLGMLAACGGSGSGGGGAGAAAGTGGVGGSGGSGATGGSSGGKQVDCGPFTSTTCYCSLEDTGNSVECSPTKNSAGGFCCAMAEWPAAGDCVCGPVLCSTIGGMCTCARGVFKTGDPSCTGTYCCLDGIGGCDCGPDPCQSGQTQVPICDATTFDCGTTVKVDKCR